MQDGESRNRTKKIAMILAVCIPAMLFLASLLYILLSNHIERKQAVRSEIQMELLSVVNGDTLKTYSKTLDMQNQVFECNIDSHLFEYAEVSFKFYTVHYKGDTAFGQTKNEVYPLYTDLALTLTHRSPNKVSLAYTIEDENGERSGTFQSKMFTYVTEEFGVGKLLENAWGKHKITVYYDGETIDTQFNLIFDVTEDKRADGIRIIPFGKDGFETIFTPYTFIPKNQTGDHDMFVMEKTVLDPSNSNFGPIYRVPCFVAIDDSDQYIAGLSFGLNYADNQWKEIWSDGLSHAAGGRIDIWGRRTDELYLNDRTQSANYIEDVPWSSGLYICSIAFKGNTYFKPVYYTCYIVIPLKI